MVNNAEFLTTVFGADAGHAHVTGFPDDPSNIADNRRLACWMGGYAKDSTLMPWTNNYFTISLFDPDQEGRARRRKPLFRATYVIVADDVKEKLPEHLVKQLPEPTYKLQTSPGSEQWGWVLVIPCADRSRVDNLLDGLVARGLAPDGKDPGMKGVTRYVRLPEGVNSKASRVTANGGTAPDCVMLEWHPDRKFFMEQLAAPFEIDLDAERKEGRVDGAAEVLDHPLLKHPDIIVKSILSDGRYDITCPWVEEHTDAIDDGAIVFTNDDGTIGFKCHHGACQPRAVPDLLRHLEDKTPGFARELKQWQTMRVLSTVPGAGAGPNFLTGQVTPPPPTHGVAPPPPPTLSFYEAPPPPDFMDPPAPEGTGPGVLVERIVQLPPGSDECQHLISETLKLVDDMSFMEKNLIHNDIRDHMGWTKADLSKAITDERAKWYAAAHKDFDFYKEMVFVTEQNAFFGPRTRAWLTTEGYQNKYSHIDSSAKVEALENGRAEKVERADYFPGQPAIFVDKGIKRINMWQELEDTARPGPVNRWLDHFNTLGWAEHRDHVLKWMAFTLRHPEYKINHALLFGGGEGVGKDWILLPLVKALGDNAITLEGDALLEQFNDMFPGRKYIHFNEVVHGDRKESAHIANKIRPMLSAPPDELRVNPKGQKPYMIRNLVNVSMTSNSAMPLHIDRNSRRFYAMWSDAVIRGDDGQVTQEAKAYWNENWKWMRDEQGWRACVHYLLTQVDLSDFDPGESPQVTDHLLEMQETAENPLHALIRELIRDGHGIFKSDLLTPEDIASHLNQIDPVGPNLRPRYTGILVGKAIKQANLGWSARCRVNGKQIRVIAIRKKERYRSMSQSEVGSLYLLMVTKARGEPSVRIAE